jgi:hypothetical protein
MMSRLNLQAAASVVPAKATTCTRAEQCEAACAAQAEGGNSGREDERAEAAGAASPTPVRATSSTRAKQREAACAAQARTAAEMMRNLKLQAAASVTPVRVMSCTRAEQRDSVTPVRATS